MIRHSESSENKQRENNHRPNSEPSDQNIPTTSAADFLPQLPGGHPGLLDPREGHEQCSTLPGFCAQNRSTARAAPTFSMHQGMQHTIGTCSCPQRSTPSAQDLRVC